MLILSCQSAEVKKENNLSDKSPKIEAKTAENQNTGKDNKEAIEKKNDKVASFFAPTRSKDMDKSLVKSHPKTEGYSPTVSADGNMLIFQSDRKKREDFKIYITKRENKIWSEPVLLDGVSSNSWDGAPFLTYDQNYLYFSSSRKGGLGDIDLWYCERLGDTWGEPVNLGAPINTSGYEGFASVSPDGKTLYFVRRDEVMKGKKVKEVKLALFYSEKIGQNKWSTPKKMPEPVNSASGEFGPVILADGKTLLFSSKRSGTIGNYDLYQSIKLDKGRWSTPVNLGKFINTKGEDSLVTIPASGDIMYHSQMDERTGYSYIEASPIPKEFQQQKVVTVSGKVMDQSEGNNPLSATIKILDLKSGKVITEANSNKVDGKYIVILNKGLVYDVSATCPGYTFYSTKIDLSNLKEYREMTWDIFLEPIRPGAKIVLNNMFFEYKKFKLSKDSKYELQRVVDLMKLNPKMRVEISGHSDNVGGAKYNKRLSQKRAEAVVKYMANKGISRKRLVARGYGESKPLVPNKNAESRKINRRVELTVLSVN